MGSGRFASQLTTIHARSPALSRSVASTPPRLRSLHFACPDNAHTSRSPLEPSASTPCSAISIVVSPRP
jgi:hypothetical protein